MDDPTRGPVGREGTEPPDDETGSRPPFDHERVLTELERLKLSVGGVPTKEQEHLQEALEQLAVALEEMQVAESELRQQNEELAATQTLLDAERRRYRELFDFAPQAYVVTDVDGNVEELNRAAGALLGWREKGLLGKPLVSFVARKERAEFRRRLLELRRVPRIADWPVRMRTLSGEAFPATIMVEAVRESPERVASLRWMIAGAQERERLLDAERAAEAEAEAASQELRKLQNVTDVILMGRSSLDALLDDLLDAVRNAVGADTATVLLATPEGNLAVRAIRGGSGREAIGEVRVPIGKGIAGTIASTKEARIVPDVLAEGAYSEALRKGAVSLIGAPLVVREGPAAARTTDRVIGVLHATTATRHLFTPKDLQLLKLVAERAAYAIESANLHEEVTRAQGVAGAAAARAAGLQSVTAALLEATTSAEVGRVVVEEATRVLDADGGLMALVSPDGEWLEITHVTGYPASLVAAWKRFPLSADLPLSQAVTSGRPVLLESSPDRQHRYPDLSETLALPDHAVACIPMTVGGRAIGGLVFRFGGPRPFEAEDVEFMNALARQAALALERARLYESEQRARAAAETAQFRMAFLAEAGAVLSGSLQVPDALESLARVAVTFLTDLCLIDMVEPDGSISRMAAVHADAEKQHLADLLLSRYAPEPNGPHPAVKVMETGRSQYASEMPESFLRATTRTEEHFQLVSRMGFQSYMCVPLVARGRVLGSFTLVSCTPDRRYGPADVALAEELAKRAALAVDNARLYGLQLHIAETLQRSLLPASLPSIPGVELAARYRAAGEGNEVGGDFYDAFQVSEEAWMVVVGDVCGKGPEAAAVTGLARHTLRALAARDPRPSRALEMLNEAILRQLGDQRFCTVCCVRVRPNEDGARLTVCSGGHPLPIVLRADGRVETVGRPNMLLGILPGVELSDQIVDVGPGDIVVLYTDGVIEEVAGSPEGASQRLERVLAGMTGQRADEVAKTVERSVVDAAGGSPRDDIAVLAIRMNPAT